jgi:hypothetical protein
MQFGSFFQHVFSARPDSDSEPDFEKFFLPPLKGGQTNNSISEPISELLSSLDSIPLKGDLIFAQTKALARRVRRA